jgi:membrane protein YqaA with SNARE-associated domain
MGVVALTLLSSPLMRALSQWVLASFASPFGIVLLAALDATLFFSFPLGIDAVVIILSARMRERAWIVPLLATLGSALGALLTFWMGKRIGDTGLERYVPSRRLARLKARLKTRGAVALALVNLIPPPFPFTLFVLVAGALDVGKGTFFGTLAFTRLIRFGLEAYLATRFGRRILGWLDSGPFQMVVLVCLVLAVILTAISIVRLVRQAHAFPLSVPSGQAGTRLD